MVDDRIEALKAVPLLKGFSDKELRSVLAISKEVAHDDGKTILEADTSGVGFHLVLHGTAEAVVGGSSVANIGPGEYFGEMSMIDGKPRSASVVAHDGLRTLVIPSWSFDQLIRKHPEMMFAMLQVLSARIRRVDASHRC